MSGKRIQSTAELTIRKERRHYHTAMGQGRDISIPVSEKLDNGVTHVGKTPCEPIKLSTKGQMKGRQDCQSQRKKELRSSGWESAKT